MWIDAKKYKHYEYIKTSLIPALELDYNRFIRKFNITETGVNVFRFEYPNREDDHADDWWAIPLIQGGEAVPPLRNPWQHATASLKEIPGVFQSIVNFIKPNGGLPMHHDFGSWQRIEEAMGHPVKGYTIAIGIDMPSNDPNVCGMEFENDTYPRTYGNKEIVALNGRDFMHKVWNRTGNWRVSCVIDTNITHWNE